MDAEVDKAINDFQDVLKGVLKDDDSAEGAMKDMEQMMSFLKQSMENAAKDNDDPAGTAQQPAN